MPCSANMPLLMPMKTGHRFADAEPTVPTVTWSAATAGAAAGAHASAPDSIKPARHQPRPSAGRHGASTRTSIAPGSRERVVGSLQSATRVRPGMNSRSTCMAGGMSPSSFRAAKTLPSCAREILPVVSKKCPPQQKGVALLDLLGLEAAHRGHEADGLLTVGGIRKPQDRPVIGGEIVLHRRHVAPPPSCD